MVAAQLLTRLFVVSGQWSATSSVPEGVILVLSFTGPHKCATSRGALLPLTNLLGK